MFTKTSLKLAVDHAIRRALGILADHPPRVRSAFDRLLRQVHRSAILQADRFGGRFGADGVGTVVGGLAALATHQRDWLRPVETWEPSGASPIPAFSSLARHLLADYPIPTFFASAWFDGLTDEARRRQGWYKHVGAGGNIRRADLPLPYSKKMAHHFLQAPDHLPVDAALRWGQVRGLGGSKGLADAVASTQLARSFEAEDFWLTVVQFFVNHPEFDLTQVGPVVDYLQNQRFESEGGPVEEGELADLPLSPPQPNLSMKGRTARSLLRQVREWHERLKRPKKVAPLSWEHSEIGDFALVERDNLEPRRSWTIRELVSSDELHREGEAMRHCVGSYVGACARGKTSIWSMRFENSERRFRVMTIEVDLDTRTIRQVRRRFNISANKKALDVMRLWAERERLKIMFWNEGAIVTG